MDPVKQRSTQSSQKTLGIVPVEKEDFSAFIVVIGIAA
jgi:hypothetical protein